MTENNDSRGPAPYSDDELDEFRKMLTLSPMNVDPRDMHEARRMMATVDALRTRLVALQRQLNEAQSLVLAHHVDGLVQVAGEQCSVCVEKAPPGPMVFTPPEWAGRRSAQAESRPAPKLNDDEEQCDVCERVYHESEVISDVCLGCRGWNADGTRKEGR